MQLALLREQQDSLPSSSTSVFHQKGHHHGVGGVVMGEWTGLVCLQHMIHRILYIADKHI